MANITEVSQWENVIRQLENGEAATGGADGLANIQAKQLANRTQWLKNNYLPLTGGRVNDFLIEGRDNTVVGIRAGSDANIGKNPGLHVYSRDYSAQSEVAGGFLLRAGNETEKKDLLGMPDGSLTWAGTDLAGSGIVAQSIIGVNGYVKYANGLIFQFGKINVTPSTGKATVQLPISFGDLNAKAFCTFQNANVGTNDTISSIVNKTTIDIYFPTGVAGNTIAWFAIGY